MNHEDQQFPNKKVLTTGAALILGLSGIIMSIIIAGAIIFVSNEDTVQEVDFDKTDNSADQNNEDDTVSDVDIYQGDRFSFEYPEKYVLTVDEEDIVRITSTPLREVNKEECEKIEDRQAWAICLDPTHDLSPNIAIYFQEGDPDQLWSDIIRVGVTDNMDSLMLGGKTWRVYQTSSEFGGFVTYGYFTPKGLVVATVTHADTGGGTRFEWLKDESYQLSRDEQKVLAEQIISTLKVEL